MSGASKVLGLLTLLTLPARAGPVFKVFMPGNMETEKRMMNAPFVTSPDVHQRMQDS